jgi:chemotaxis family two-component system response regulator Rcp1
LGATGRPIQILLVEDSPSDVRLTTEALKKAKVANELHVVGDGEQALDYLRNANAPRPHLVLLDLNLPRKDGREVLADVKEDPDLRRIPVVVLTASSADEDVARSYDLHANCYIKKPVGLSSLMEVVASIETFWLQIVELPPD